MQNNFNIKILSLLTLFVFGFISCEDVVQVQLENEDVNLVSVEAYINTNEKNNIYVKLERTLPVDESDDNPAIHGANVKLSDDRETPNIISLREYQSSGIYLLPQNAVYPVETGRTYHLDIALPDGVRITGSDFLRKVEKLDSVKVQLSARGDFQFLAVFINAQETSGPGDFYKWDIYINDNMLYQSHNIVIANDELVDGNYIYDFEIFTDFAANDDERILLKGDTVRVEQLSISETAYDFYMGMMNQAFTGGPFSVPPANLPGNLTSSDGKRVLGIFSARDISIGNNVVIGDNNFQPLY